MVEILFKAIRIIFGIKDIDGLAENPPQKKGTAVIDGSRLGKDLMACLDAAVAQEEKLDEHEVTAVPHCSDWVPVPNDRLDEVQRRLRAQAIRKGRAPATPLENGKTRAGR